MSVSREQKTNFAGTFFQRDKVLQLSRLAGVISWVALCFYLLTSAFSFSQFLVQFMSGLYYQKGMSGVDAVNFFSPYLLQPLPGLFYFAGLKFIQHALLILLDIED